MKGIGACFKEQQIDAKRPWWEPPYVIYSFSNPRVRSTLQRLMGTDVVRATDREYMVKLQLTKREDHSEAVRKKIRDRAMGEVERVKRLILEGKMPMEEAPKELTDHPVFRIAQLTKKIAEERKLEEEKKRRRVKVERLNYEALERRDMDLSEDSEISSCINLVISDEDRDRKIQDREDYISHDMANFTDDDYRRIKYMDPLVEELLEAEGVDELYELADEVVGPLRMK